MTRKALALMVLILAACAQSTPYPSSYDGVPEPDIETARLIKEESEAKSEAATGLAAFHAAKVADFLAVEESRGVSRMASMRAFHELPMARGVFQLVVDPNKPENQYVNSDERYVLDRFQLVSTEGDEAAVYLVSENRRGSVINAATARRRGLNFFEADALPRLRGGEDIVAQERGKDLNVLGAIRARRSCTACHTDAEEGELLGAFTYHLKREKRSRELAAR